MLPQPRQVIALHDNDVTNGETVTCNIDTLGYDFASIDISLSISSAVSVKLSTLNLLECDTTDGSFATVSGFVSGTDWTIPNAVTSGFWGVKMNVDCTKRKRYLRLAITPTTTATVVALANLFRGDEAPVSTTKANVKALVEG